MLGAGDMEMLEASVHMEAAEYNACVVWGGEERLKMRDKARPGSATYWLYDSGKRV